MGVSEGGTMARLCLPIANPKNDPKRALMKVSERGTNGEGMLANQKNDPKRALMKVSEGGTPEK